MAKLKIGICGWGNVATGLYEQLINGNELYSDWEISCIGARRDNPRCNPGSTKIIRDIFDVVKEDIDVLVELIGGVETARDLITEALNSGKHVVTANKAVIFEHGEELINLAIKNNVRLLFESAVCAGTPTIKILSNANNLCVENNYKEIVIIGGGYLFRETLDIVNKLVLTRVDCDIDGDVYYPEINLENWRETSSIEHKKDSENEYDFKVVVLEKN